MPTTPYYKNRIKKRNNSDHRKTSTINSGVAEDPFRLRHTNIDNFPSLDNALEPSKKNPEVKKGKENGANRENDKKKDTFLFNVSPEKENALRAADQSSIISYGDVSLDLSIGARAALAEHRHYVMNHGIDGDSEFDSFQPKGEGGAPSHPQYMSYENPKERQWSKLMNNQEITLNGSTIEQDFDDDMCSSFYAHRSICETSDYYFNSSRINILMTPDRNKPRVDEASRLARLGQGGVTVRGQESFDDEDDDEEEEDDSRSELLSGDSQNDEDDWLNGNVTNNTNELESTSDVHHVTNMFKNNVQFSDNEEEEAEENPDSLLRSRRRFVDWPDEEQDQENENEQDFFQTATAPPVISRNSHLPSSPSRMTRTIPSLSSSAHTPIRKNEASFLLEGGSEIGISFSDVGESFVTETNVSRFLPGLLLGTEENENDEVDDIQSSFLLESNHKVQSQRLRSQKQQKSQHSFNRSAYDTPPSSPHRSESMANYNYLEISPMEGGVGLACLNSSIIEKQRDEDIPDDNDDRDDQWATFGNPQTSFIINHEGNEYNSSSHPIFDDESFISSVEKKFSSSEKNTTSTDGSSSKSKRHQQQPHSSFSSSFSSSSVSFSHKKNKNNKRRTSQPVFHNQKRSIQKQKNGGKYPPYENFKLMTPETQDVSLTPSAFHGSSSDIRSRQRRNYHHGSGIKPKSLMDSFPSDEIYE